MCVKFHNFIKRIDLHDHFEYDFSPNVFHFSIFSNLP